ncbi:MAG: MATE family efflux transporter [Subdoligranulum sp.]
MSAMQDMTKGGAAGHLLRYAVPLMLGNWFQLAYNAVDSIIAGRFIGKDALAAEGIAGPVMNLVILGITGVCLGAGVLMSEFFGAKDGESLRRELATTVLSGTAACTVVALLGVLFTPAILQACAVPREIFAITAIYLRITFLGAPFTCFYNALAAGFKSVGDARTPLRFLMVSAILNATLDLIFIGGLGFGIVCSAMTTVIAEAFSAVLAGWWLWTKTPELCPRRGQWRVDRSLLGRTLQYGGVSALQQAVQPIGKVLIQGQVNALGVEVIAAFNAVTRIDDFACIPEQSIAQGITTYIAQNRGAGRQDRIRRGFAVGLGMEAAYWMLIGGVVTLFKTPLAAMFVTGEGADRVIALAVQYLGTMALFYLLPAMTNGFQGYYRGMGNMPMTLLGTLIQTSLRVVTTCILAPRMGMYGIAFACATGWCVMLMVEVPFTFGKKCEMNNGKHKGSKKSWAIPHNSKCRYGERGCGSCQAKSADNTGCCKGERRQWRKQRTEAGAAVAECEGLLSPKHDAGTATRHYRAFWQRRCRAAVAGAVLKPQGGNCAVLPLTFDKKMLYCYC